jgi:pyruvate-ferredoxin/flavodoxin oxidoreductase
MVDYLKEGGIFLLNSPWSTAELDEKLPASMKRALAAKKIRFYNIDAIDIARETVWVDVSMLLCNPASSILPMLYGRTSNRLYQTAVVKSYGKRGEEVVRMNFAAIDQSCRFERNQSA